MDGKILSEQPAQSTERGQIEAKKARFFKTVKLTGILVVIGVIALISIIIVIEIISKNKKTFIVPEPTQSAEEQQTTFPISEDNTWTLFKSDKYMFSARYPHTDIFQESTFFLISYEDTKPRENIGTENITEGYFVKITPLKVPNITTYNAASAKRENFIEICPTVANISKVFPIVLGGLMGEHFTAKNCNVDYLIAYVKFGNYVFEIIQAYKGDLGYKQVYKTTSEEILSSIRFIQMPGEEEEVPLTMTYTDQFDFSFEYQTYLDKDCCDVPEPPISVPSKRIVLAESSDDKAIGFFAGYRSNSNTQSFSDYVEKQKQILIDEYTVVKGVQPTGTQENLAIGGMQSISLKGYSWKGNELIYIPLKFSDRVLVISKTNISQEVYQDIVDSFKIY